VHELFVQTFPRFKEFEPQLRAAAQLALEQWALERAGLLEEEPYRRGHRVRSWSMRWRRWRRSLPKAVRDRLHRALSVVYGIEPYIILKDIWGARPRGRAHRAVDGRRADRRGAARVGPARARRGAPLVARSPRSAAAAAVKAPSRSRRARREGRSCRPQPPPGTTSSTTTARASPSTRPSCSDWAETLGRGARHAALPRWTCPTGRASARRWTSSRPGRRRQGRRCWCTSTAATGARWTSAQSFVATPFVRAGAMVVLPNYALCPAVSVRHIVLQMVQALAWVARHMPSTAATRAHRGGRPFGRRAPGGHDAGLPLAAGGADLPPQLVRTARGRCRACSTWSRCATHPSWRPTWA
jgi:hypothetical protein